jgi:hypothetical protein
MVQLTIRLLLAALTLLSTGAMADYTLVGLCYMIKKESKFIALHRLDFIYKLHNYMVWLLGASDWVLCTYINSSDAWLSNLRVLTPPPKVTFNLNMLVSAIDRRWYPCETKYCGQGQPALGTSVEKLTPAILGIDDQADGKQPSE